MKQTAVTCHECRTSHDYYVTRWPPEIFVCSECGSIFQLVDVSITGEPIFDLTGYCRYDDD